MNKISISKRAANTPASAIRKLVPYADAAKKRGIHVYHVNIGDPDLPTPDSILQSIRNTTLSTIGYAPSTGIAQTREAWSQFYKHKNINFDASDIIVTSGGSEGLIFAFFTVGDPGDEIVVFDPFYTSYAIIAAMGNIKLVPVLTRASTGFHLPKKQVIEKVITKRTKAIVVCNPNNPTGTRYTDEEVKMLADIAYKHNLFIVSDETYQEIVFDGKRVLPFASMKKLAQQLIVVDSVSKRFNACGVRIGCVASKNAEVIGDILRFAQSRLSVATIEQLAVVDLLKNHKEYVSKIKNIYEGRRNTVMAALRKIPSVSFAVPEGAFYFIPKLPIDDSDKFAVFLLNKFSDRNETIMVAPATGFYATPGLGRDEIRIAYVLDEKKLERAMELLGMAIERYNKK